MDEYPMTIGGQSVSGAGRLGVINPATEEVFAFAPACSGEQLDDAMEAAKAAFPEWRADESFRRGALSSDGIRVVDEEQFGPALPVIPYRDVDDAVARANATHFGLSGSVWGADPEVATGIARRLECGTAWVNTHLALAPHQPFGGSKWSGIGVENGTAGLLGFTEPQVVHRAR